MPVRRSTYNAALDQVDALQAHINTLTGDIRRLTRRNLQVMPLVKNAKVGLDSVFNGIVEIVPENEADTVVLGLPVDEYLVYAATSTLANIALRPHDGQLLVMDPQHRVTRVVKVSVDAEGRLDQDELEEIDRFLRDVSWSREGRSVCTTGPVSLIAAPPASTEDELVPTGA